MQDYQEAMVKSLIAVAWADGKVEDEETEVIDGDQSAEELALLDDLQNRLHLEEAEAKELREMATSRAQRLLQLM